MAETLPRDILDNIFSRLPIKSVLRCKRVCRPWRTIIGNNVGLLLTFHTIPKTTSHRVTEPYYGDPKYETKVEEYYSKNTLTPLKAVWEAYAMIGSCNGLVCYKAINHSKYSNDYLNFICNNPITGEAAYISVSENQGRYFRSPVGGFGYVGSTNEYKVVRIHFKYWGGIVQVYTLGSHLGWRDKGNVPPLSPIFSTKESGVFANGALHWINDCEQILVFGLADEEFCFIPSPPYYTYNNNWLYSSFKLILLGGNLCVVHSNYEFTSRRLDIWVLKKNIGTSCGNAKRKRRENYYDQTWSWSKEYSITWEGEVMYTPFVVTKLNTILLWQNGTSDLYYYDPKTSKLQRYCDGYRGYVYDQAIPHMNSLVSLKEIGETSYKYKKMMLGWTSELSTESKSALVNV
ncbi:F-box protein At3g07870-like [Papaver somniferum]|uniref:F-box protein At3g07870-like n=1 Tax=Papaver somniferum TaxID=3469 RepID=UPI000E6F9344|nr:F-box protein At3g07870-like [Papaver somniferum]